MLPSEIINRIDAMNTLIENFPMSLFDLFTGDGKYDSVLDFIIDVLKELGITDANLVDELINLFFNVPNAIEMYTNISNYRYQLIKKPTEEQILQAETITEEEFETPTETSPYYCKFNDYYYVKKAPLPTEPQSEFLDGLETSVKIILQNILSSVLSCSIIPEIPDKYLDVPINGYTEYTTETLDIPLSVIDNFNLLNISPTSEIGNNYYSNVEDLTSNTMYKATDLNAFLWYVINRGTSLNQSERNKMMWDSRVTNKSEERDTPQKWNYWIRSKSANTITEEDYKSWLFFTSGNSSEEDLRDIAYENFISGKTIYRNVHPILQFEQVNGNSPEKYIRIKFPTQTFGVSGEGKFNKTLYEFNNDYLNNIQIFNPRLIITEMINALLDGNLTNGLNIQLSVEKRVFEAQLSSIIKKAMEKEDLTISDCFFSFSNEDFDEALKKMELEKYNGKMLNSESSPAIAINNNYALDALNQINSMATMNEKIDTINRTVFDITSIPSKDESVLYSDKSSVSYNEQWMNDVLMALIMPLLKAVLTPKVMLLFVINFQLMGLVNIEDVETLQDVMKVFYRKIISSFVSIVTYIKDKIIEHLLNLFYKTISPILFQYILKLINERLQYWIKLLEEAKNCLALFLGYGNRGQNQLDEVNYADITETQEIPEKDKSC